jgi:hypothetical protein
VEIPTPGLGVQVCEVERGTVTILQVQLEEIETHDDTYIYM